MLKSLLIVSLGVGNWACYTCRGCDADTFSQYFKVISAIGIFFLDLLEIFITFKLTQNNWLHFYHSLLYLFLCSVLVFSLFFPVGVDSTTAWEARAAYLIIINLWLLSVLSQPWQFLLHSFYCSLLQGTENTHLCVKYLLKTQDKALSTGSCERAKRANDLVLQYSTTWPRMHWIFQYLWNSKLSFWEWTYFNNFLIKHIILWILIFEVLTEAELQ